MPAPVGAVIVIVPVGVVHVGCVVTVAVGCAGEKFSVTATMLEAGTLQVPFPLIAA